MTVSNVRRGLLLALLLMTSFKYEVVTATFPIPFLGDIITPEFFELILTGVSPDCPGLLYYGFLPFAAALTVIPSFLTTGSLDVCKREAAAFFAHAAHETLGWCNVAQQNVTSDYCDPSYTKYPCVPHKRYYGRGALALTWNYNYGAAGDYCGFDGLEHPEFLEDDAILGFKASIWYWVVQSKCHATITSGLGFGKTIRALHGKECDGGDPDAVSSRVKYYKHYCGALGVDPGSDLEC